MKIFKILRPNHLIGNSLIFTIGTAIALKTGANINFNYVFGLVSFLLLYGSIYAINDIHDINEDKNHEIKWKRERPLAKGEIKVSHAKIAVLVFLIISFITSFLINMTFFLASFLLFTGNIIYTYILKDKKVAISLFLVGLFQSIKIFLGIVSIGGTEYPLNFMLMYSFGYSFVMGVYKKKKLKTKFKKFEITMGILALINFLLSFGYPYLKNALILLILIGILGGYVVNKIKNKLSEFFTKGILITCLFNFVLLITILFT